MKKSTLVLLASFSASISLFGCRSYEKETTEDNVDTTMIKTTEIDTAEMMKELPPIVEDKVSNAKEVKEIE